MKDFIDLKGASGGSYRFRRWPEGGSHLPIAGNYIVVRADGQNFTVLEIGENGDLSRTPHDWRGARDSGRTQVFTRLNVSRATRTAEHNDLAAAYSDAQVRQSAD